MSADTLNATPNGNAPSATWTALLECAEAAENGELNLVGSAPQVVALAEHLVDLGFLRVPRAAHYALTPVGRELLGQSRTGAASIKPRRCAPHLFSLVLAAIAAAVVWLWLGSVAQIPLGIHLVNPAW